MRMLRALRLFAVVAGVCLWLSLGGSSAFLLEPAAAGSMTVKMADLAYTPADIAVNAGDSVTWTNNEASPIPHTVASSGGGPLKSGSMDVGESYTYKFTSAGEFPYLCEIHPDMKGIVRVSAAPAEAKPAPAPAPAKPAAPPPAPARTSPSPAAPAIDVTPSMAPAAPPGANASSTEEAGSSPAPPARAAGESGGGPNPLVLVVGLLALAGLGAAGVLLSRRSRAGRGG